MMRIAKTHWRVVLLATLLVVSAVAAVFTQPSRSQKEQKAQHRGTYEAAKVTTPPRVSSNIKGLEISGVNLINQGTPESAVAIDVVNNRDEAVMALDFVAGKNDYSGLRFDGLLQEDNPLIIIPPHSLKTFEWSLGSVMQGETISLEAAIFADGKEEGNKRFLDALKKTRIKFQENRREERARNGGQK